MISNYADIIIFLYSLCIINSSIIIKIYPIFQEFEERNELIVDAPPYICIEEEFDVFYSGGKLLVSESVHQALFEQFGRELTIDTLKTPFATGVRNEADLNDFLNSNN